MKIWMSVLVVLLLGCGEMDDFSSSLLVDVSVGGIVGEVFMESDFGMTGGDLLDV